MKKEFMFTLTVIGFVLIVAGLCYLKSSSTPEGIMIALPYICISIGCGAFGHGIGELISKRATKNIPDIAKQIEIEKHDERNIEIANRAKGKAYDAMIYIFGALLVSFALMGFEVYKVLMLAFAYFLVVGISIYYRCKFDKEM